MKWLSSISLTIPQWVIVSLTALIGFLLVALRLQGGRLHRAQVELLAERFHKEVDKEDGKVEEARHAFLEALEAYKAAKED